MDVSSILIQPDGGAMLAAYRPIYFRVLADSLATPDQPMYADVYFNSVYYKTFSATTIINDGSGHSIFEFNVMDAAQEYLTVFIPQPPTLLVTQANDPQPNSLINDCTVLFRGSTFSGTLLVPNPTVPIQGTSTSAPVSGTGTASNSFTILNATLNPDWFVDSIGLNELEYVLNANKVADLVISDTRAYGLSNLPSPPLMPNPINAVDTYAPDHGVFPIIIAQFGTSGILPLDMRNCTVRLRYWANGSAFDLYELVAPNPITLGTWYLPCGLRDIAILAPAAMPALLNPDNDAYYRVYLKDNDSNAVVVWSNVFHCKNTGLEESRLFFQNHYGHFEAVSFVRSSQSHKATSTEYFRPYLNYFSGTAPYGPQQYQQTGRTRMNTRGQDEYQFFAVFTESQIGWLKELMHSNLAYLDVPDTLTGSTSHSMTALRILDAEFEVQKSVMSGRFNYMLTIKAVPALDYNLLRN